MAFVNHEGLSLQKELNPFSRYFTESTSQSLGGGFMILVTSET